MKSPCLVFLFLSAVTFHCVELIVVLQRPLMMTNDVIIHQTSRSLSDYSHTINRCLCLQELMAKLTQMEAHFESRIDILERQVQRLNTFIPTISKVNDQLPQIAGDLYNK